MRLRVGGVVTCWWLVIGGLGLVGCKDVTGNQPLPAGTVSPAFYNTPAGALELQSQALNDLQQALPGHIVATGLLTDELQDRLVDASPGVLLSAAGGNAGPVDARILPDESYDGRGKPTVDNDYGALQRVRGEIGQALAAIAAYDTGTKAIGDPHVLRAELFALQGYTEILLADFFCSGIPLSTFDFQRDYTYHASSTTAQVYQDALALEDSALALADTSTQIQYLARVLKGRALLDLDNVAGAAQVVAPVPDGFEYQLSVNFPTVRPGSPTEIGANQLNGNDATVADMEGQNGLPYISSGDPRSAVVVTLLPNTGSTVPITVPSTFPIKYQYADGSSGFSPFVVASGVEARLIQAEAMLRGSDPSWLTILNALRTSGSVASTYTRTCQNGIEDANGNVTQVGSPCPAGVIDTTWSPGTGIYLIPAAVRADTGPVCPASPDPGTPCTDTVWYKGLHPLSDPGVGSTNPDSARTALLFQERAFWLFLTGERQGDLRRLLRQYSQWFRSQDQVYPTGAYTAPGSSVYGTDVTAPISGQEYLNPLFHGCLDRNP